MVSPFDKLLDLGLKGSSAPKAEKAPCVAAGVSSKPGRPKNAKRKKRATVSAQPSPATPKLGKSKNKAKQPKHALKMAPAFVTSLPKVQLLTENGFKKPPPARLPKKGMNSRADKKAVTDRPNTKKAKARPKPLAVEATVQGQICRLPDRTMAELQLQWINMLSYMEKRPQHMRVWKEFHDALVAEWGRRHRIAIGDPDHFVWPSTKVGPGDRSQTFNNWHSEGMLGYMGYRVGSTNGATEFARRKILDVVFLSVLPPINDPTYVRDWGFEGTASRLKRLAHEIARFAQNGKRKRSADMSSAVADWEADLRYLYRQYYVGKFGFGWPDLGR